MITLIGDIGNTEIKLCLINSKYQIIKRSNISKKKVYKDKYIKKEFFKFIGNKKISKTSLFSSVVPSAFNIIKKIIFKKFKTKILEIKKIPLDDIIKIKVNKKQVGSDRISNAIASHYLYKSNCIVIDFGTATTFDIIKNGIYHGGVISPGIKISLETLVNKAEQIPTFSIKKTLNVVGKNTVNALRAGFFWGYVGLINNIIVLIKKETKCNFKIILTGGFSHLFKESLKYKVLIDKDITIKGLIEVLKFKKFK